MTADAKILKRLTKSENLGACIYEERVLGNLLWRGCVCRPEASSPREERSDPSDKTSYP